MVEGYPRPFTEPKPAARDMVVCLVFSKPCLVWEPGGRITEVEGRAPLVLLALKRRPKWQVGMWNGPGGAAEGDEIAPVTASRELLEETGLSIESNKWRMVCSLRAPDFRVRVLAHTLPLGSIFLPTMARPDDLEPETLKWFDTDKLPESVIPDLRWLIPFALDDRFSFPEIFFRTDLKFVPSVPRTGGKETD